MDIELFDKRYVHLEWSDELEGKDCIIATTYKDLKDFVNSGDEGRIFKIDKGNEKPFTNHWKECDFCYFDPNLKVKKAWIEGKKVQYWSSFDKWEDFVLAEYTNIEEYLNLDWDKYEWRIKPSETKEWYVTMQKFYNTFMLSTKTYDEYVFYHGTEKECNEWIKEHKSMKDIMRAWLNDETIQFYDKDGKAWIIVNNPKWDKDFKYRVKPKESTRRMTNRELARWIVEGNGEWSCYDTFSIYNDEHVYSSYTYRLDDENKEVNSNIRIRKWDSDEWEEPLVEVE